MEIITQKTKKHKDGVAVVPWSFISCRKLSWDAKAVFIFLNELDKWGSASPCPTFRKIAENTGLTCWKVGKALKYLERGNYLKIHFEREFSLSNGRKRRSGLSYEIIRRVKLGKKDLRAKYPNEGFEWE